MAPNVAVRVEYEAKRVTHRLIASCIKGSRNRVLDIGCGDGGLAAALARSGHDVTAIDLLPLPKTSAGAPFYFLQQDALTVSSHMIGTFDTAIVSLVTLYLGSSDLVRLWKILKDTVEPQGKVIMVDLHPASKVVDAVPWRKILRGSSSYWADEKCIAAVRKGDISIETEYWHHSLHELMTPPLRESFCLDRIVEFPKRWNAELLQIPAYLLTRWTRT